MTKIDNLCIYYDNNGKCSIGCECDNDDEYIHDNDEYIYEYCPYDEDSQSFCICFTTLK